MNETPMIETPMDWRERNAIYRENARHSTGPKTEEGKKRSSLNASRHGLTGQVLLFTPEDRRAFDAHCAGIVQHFEPIGAFELDLAQSIAEDRWRLKRARAMDNGMQALGHGEGPETEHPEVGEALDQAVTWARDARNLQLLSLYESRIQRNSERNLNELRRLQAERREKEKQALEEALLLAQLAALDKQPWDHAKDQPPCMKPNGFVFSNEQIERYLDRQERLAEARRYIKKAA